MREKEFYGTPSNTLPPREFRACSETTAVTRCFMSDARLHYDHPSSMFVVKNPYVNRHFMADTGIHRDNPTSVRVVKRLQRHTELSKTQDYTRSTRVRRKK